jgi:hypothetical protein
VFDDGAEERLTLADGGRVLLRQGRRLPHASAWPDRLDPPR